MSNSDAMPKFVGFVCDNCQSKLKVDAGLVGKQAQCPSCGSVSDVVGRPLVSLPDSNDGDAVGKADPSPSFRPAAAVTRSQSPVVGAASLQPARRSEAQSPTVKTQPAELAGETVDAVDTETRQLYRRICEEVAKVFVGQDELVEGTLVALFSGGHVLIESVPGLGKTLFVRTLGKILGCEFGRIQFTADLMPSDITGAPIFSMKTQEFEFRPGPVFTQLLLADEINRSPAKTHAALLEIMQEKRVTVDGKTHELDLPFLVVATQNPIESEGTYRLPEAQLDRFMFKLVASYPTEQQESDILLMHGGQQDFTDQLEAKVQQISSPEQIVAVTQESAAVRIDPLLVDYINKLVRLTRHWPQFYMGASPRAGIGLMQGARTLAAFRGRDFAVPDDVVKIAVPTLRHRVMLTAEAEVEGHTVDGLLKEMIATVEVPRIK